MTITINSESFPVFESPSEAARAGCGLPLSVPFREGELDLAAGMITDLRRGGIPFVFVREGTGFTIWRARGRRIARASQLECYRPPEPGRVLV